MAVAVKRPSVHVSLQYMRCIACLTFVRATIIIVTSVWVVRCDPAQAALANVLAFTSRCIGTHRASRRVTATLLRVLYDVQNSGRSPCLTSLGHALRMLLRTSSRFLASSRKSNSVKNCFSTSFSITRCSGCARAQKSFIVLMSDLNIASTFGNITYKYKRAERNSACTG